MSGRTITKRIAEIVTILCLPLPILIPFYGQNDSFRSILEAVLVVAFAASVLSLIRERTVLRYGLTMYYLIFCGLMLLKVVAV